jgi:hypothetical protein
MQVKSRAIGTIVSIVLMIELTAHAVNRSVRSANGQYQIDFVNGEAASDG